MLKKWKNALEKIDFAFQPIVNVQTGITISVEALLRNIEQTEFKTIDNFFDSAFHDGVLFPIDAILRDKAVRKFVTIPWHEHVKLFYNYDPRICTMPDYEIGATEKILQKYGLPIDKICFELSEKHRFSSDNLNKLVNLSHKRGIRIAIDDFGSGFSGLELFYNAEPDFVKFDKFLISEIDSSAKKRSICRNLINLSKIFGATVIAEGVETAEELYFCMELGFDMVQGFYTARPKQDTAEIDFINNRILDFKNSINYRNFRNNSLKKRIVKPAIVRTSDPSELIISVFRNDPEIRAIPVLDSNNYPVGIIRDRDVSRYIYSPFGYDLMMNKSLERSIERFISHCPVADINSTEDEIKEIYLKEYDCDGIIITWNLEYYGFLPRNAIINIINKKFLPSENRYPQHFAV